MLVYNDEERPLLAWNAVDVRIKGKLKHGHVIDVAEGGLIVDFGCDDQRAKFIQFRRISKQPEDSVENYIFDSFFPYFRRPKDDAQVLLRSPATGAWIWYPGKVVALGGYRSEFADFVEVQMPDGRTIRELMPIDQVRLPLADMDYVRVYEDQFVIGSCTLPWVSWEDESYWLQEVFKRELNGRFGVLCMSLLGSTVRYLQDEGWTLKKLLKPKKVMGVYRWAKKEEQGGFTSAESRWVLRHMASSPDSGTGQQQDGEHCAMPLPVELLVEVFQSLDSIERFRCRRVNPLWNSILTTDANFPFVSVSGKVGAYSKLNFRKEEEFWVAAGLLKCLSSRTQMAVIMGLDMLECRDLFDLFQHLVHTADISRLPTLVFYECIFGTGYGAGIDRILEDVAEMMLEWLPCCDRILWKQCRIVDRNLTALVAQHSFGVPCSLDAVKRELWELFECQNAVASPGDRDDSADGGN
ncbi:uncharacterized protein LOC129585489 [Paramacrobiotus metropolitanus]|uniref:uncharacterized protein LOC129585489 n=1 Tax=Paramacrobiotus metropolitanus TaxID=2943436 RepID=UPI002445EA6C|nr:uncharacterized protein LOC129585489 [Paramacrobiotus metropolitanus]